MHFYIDETGQTGQHLFDPDQKTLYYGLLSCKQDIDAVAEQTLIEMRKKLNVDELHATVLGNHGLLKILPELIELHQRLDFSISFHALYKPEHAASQFFDVVFDSRRNPAVSSLIWNSVDRIALRDGLVAGLFTETISKSAWAVRLNESTNPDAEFRKICSDLIARLPELPFKRLRSIYFDALTWATDNYDELHFPARTPEHKLDTMPNMQGFQLVLFQIAAITVETGLKPRRIIIDAQMQFNIGQRKLKEFYASAAATDTDWGFFPELGEIDFANMPDIPLEFSSHSCGLELVDIYLWVYRRFKEGLSVAPALLQLLNVKPIVCSEISVKGTRERWAPYFAGGKSALLRELATEGKAKRHWPKTVTFNILGRSF